MPTQTEQFDQVLTEYLVLRAQEGNADAAELLVRRWHGRLLGHAHRIADRDDVMQEAWASILRQLRGLRDPARFGPWAYRIVTGQAALWVRHRARRRQVERPVDPLPERAAPPVDDGAEAQRQALQDGLRELSPADAAILNLRYARGLGIDDIAEAMGLPAGTVKSRLFQARHRLRSRLEASASDVPGRAPLAERTLP